MNKKELTMAIANETGLLQKDVEAMLNCFCKTVTATLERQEKIKLIGFGSFDIRERKARIAKNLKTGEPIQVEAGKTVVFKAGKELKEKVNSLAGR